MNSDTDSQDEKQQEEIQLKEKLINEHIFKARPRLSKKDEKKAEMQFTVYQGLFTLCDDWKDTYPLN